MDKLKIWREGRGLSREAVAAMAGVSLSTYMRWEAGTSAPDYYQIRAIADALGLRVLKLLKQIERAGGNGE